MRNKKLISILTAAMMLTGFAAPSVLADEVAVISEAEIEALDAAEAIASNDFEAEEEGVRIAVETGTANPETYTGISPLAIDIGYGRRKGDADTNAAVTTIDTEANKTKALELAYAGDLAASGAEFGFVIPEGTESYKISFDVYPASDQDTQDVVMIDSVEADDEVTEVKKNLGLEPDAWSTIEIYVTKSGRLVNVKDVETVIEDESTVVPKFSGIKTKGRGSIYVDNITISAIEELPERIPDVKIGSEFNFDEYTAGTLVFLNNVDTPVYEGVKGFKLYVGTRTTGPRAGTKAAIESGVGMDNTSCLSITYAENAEASRGPRVKLIEPVESNYTVSFYIKADDKQSLILGDSTSENKGTQVILPQEWTLAQIIMSNGTRTTLLGGKVVETVATTALPVLWGENVAGSGTFWIDNYKVTETDLETLVAVIKDSLDIASDTYAEQVSYDAENNRYDITGEFAVSTASGILSIDWSSADETLVKFVNGKVMVTPKEDTTVDITATITAGDVTDTKTFTLNLDAYYDKVQKIIDDELVKTVVAPNGSNGSKITTLTLDSESTTTVSYDLSLPLVSSTQKGVDIKWETSDKNIITKDGVINVDNMDKNEVTLTKTVTYSENGKKLDSGTKDYKINVQFDPEAVKPVAEELAKAYALATDTELSEETYEKSNEYTSAMEILYDRYVTRFDANYAENFADIPDEVDDDFSLPTEGAFGSEISWASSITNIKVNSKGNATVTQASNDRTAKLSATFTSGAAINANGKEIEVVVEGKGGSGGSGGGRGSSSGGGNSYVGSLGIVTQATPKPSTVAPADTTVKGEFTDLGDVSWAAVAINYLADKGIVAGRTSTTFAPNDNITRAEFAKMITGVFELPIGGASAGFADVPADSWYAPYVDTCFAAGIITGYDALTFGPNDLVTRQDMAVMVMRAATLKGITVEAVNAKIDFADADQIGAYAIDAVSTLQQGGIINGMTADTFAPTANATRAQAAKILYSFCK